MAVTNSFFCCQILRVFRRCGAGRPRYPCPSLQRYFHLYNATVSSCFHASPVQTHRLCRNRRLTATCAATDTCKRLITVTRTLPSQAHDRPNRVTVVTELTLQDNYRYKHVAVTSALPLQTHGRHKRVIDANSVPLQALHGYIRVSVLSALPLLTRYRYECVTVIMHYRYKHITVTTPPPLRRRYCYKRVADSNALPLQPYDRCNGVIVPNA